MIINKIEYENFRNFKDYGEIKCSTDGKVTIIYGKNGDGKTTLHQLFQWIFYGQVKFNKTTTDRLYNLQYENECSLGDTFKVFGSIEFEHDNVKYFIKREQTYRKDINDSIKIAEDLSLQYMDSNYSWRKMNKPKEVIEKLLPSGLAEYFFFDGESMIADLRVKGRDSAMKLKKALYSMFDLDILDSAINHIGRTDLKTTVLGKIYLDKGTSSSDSAIQSVVNELTSIQDNLSIYENELQKLNIQKEENQNLIKNVSEKIGSHKSKAEYENRRRKLKSQRDGFIEASEKSQARFGEDVFEMFPFILISKSIEEAKKKIHLKIEEKKLPEGVSKKLINYLLAKTTTKCICGHDLGEEEKKYIKAFLELLPPNSYTSLYQEFTSSVEKWKHKYDRSRIEEHIQDALNYDEKAGECDKDIKELDEEEKKNPDVEDLIEKRQKAEENIEKIVKKISDLNTKITFYQAKKKRKTSDFDQLTKGKKESEKANRKISIMNEVLEYFEKKLEEESLKYSKFLQENIQSLINEMLTSKRRVFVSPEFSVRVTDSYNDESKSEGQFAVVSFAYIGGILKMLSTEEHLSNKEYPLVLDGPFSKLDADQRKNVVDMLPKFAPQVIIFSKDDLHKIFDPENIGYVWTIKSNEEKNIAHVEEGHLWK